MTYLSYLSVALGGAVGAMLRYGLSGWVQSATGFAFPFGTLAVNILGSFVLGAAMQLGTGRFLLSVETRLLITTGFCGSLTTFSTFSYETLVLLEDQQWQSAAGNILLNVVVCLTAAYLGIVTARLL